MLVPTPRMNKTMIPISLIAYDDNPLGLQKMHIDNQLIMSCHILRKDLDRALDLMPELTQSGVYFLLNNKRDKDMFNVYVGKSGNLHSRIKTHHIEDKKDFESIVCIFGYREDTLDSTAIDWLEMVLIRDIRGEIEKGNNVTLLNTVDGNSSLLQERREVTLSEYAQIIKWYLFRFGYNYSEVGGVKKKIEVKDDEEIEPEVTVISEESTYLILGKGKGVEKVSTPIFYEEDTLTIRRLALKGEVRAYYDFGSGYTYILKGSKMKVEFREAESRKGLGDDEFSNKVKREGMLDYKEGDEYGLLKNNIAFKSPSMAATAIIGGLSNGRIEWVNKEDKTLGDLYLKVSK